MTNKLSDSELSDLMDSMVGSIDSWFCSDYIKQTAKALVEEVMASRKAKEAAQRALKDISENPLTQAFEALHSGRGQPMDRAQTDHAKKPAP